MADRVGKIFLLGGEEKTGKTKMGLSWKKPMSYYEFDIGGYERGIDLIRKQNPDEEKLITRRQYPLPMQAEKLLLQVSVGQNKSILQSPKLQRGMKELWFKFLTDVVEDCKNPDLQTLVFDTWKAIYDLDTSCYLQELQEKQINPTTGQLLDPKDKLRTSLTQIEYKEPYNRLRNILFYVRGCGKDLVLITYDAEEYIQQIDKDGRIESVRSGRKLYDGWKETEKHIDCAIWLKIGRVQRQQDDGTIKEIPVPIPKITLPGLAPLSMVGTELYDNSYTALVQHLEMEGVKLA